jgi:hypothetical protein
VIGTVVNVQELTWPHKLQNFIEIINLATGANEYYTGLLDLKQDAPIPVFLFVENRRL